MTDQALNISTQLNDDDELLTSRQLARWLKVSDVTLARDRLKGDGIPFIKLGRRKQSIVRYRRSDVERYLADRTRRSTSDPGIEASA